MFRAIKNLFQAIPGDIPLAGLSTVFFGGSSTPAYIPEPPPAYEEPEPPPEPPVYEPAPDPYEAEREAELEEQKKKIKEKQKGRGRTILTGLLTEEPQVKKPALKEKFGE